MSAPTTPTPSTTHDDANITQDSASLTVPSSQTAFSSSALELVSFLKRKTSLRSAIQLLLTPSLMAVASSLTPTYSPEMALGLSALAAMESIICILQNIPESRRARDSKSLPWITGTIGVIDLAHAAEMAAHAVVGDASLADSVRSAFFLAHAYRMYRLSQLIQPTIQAAERNTPDSEDGECDISDDDFIGWFRDLVSGAKTPHDDAGDTSDSKDSDCACDTPDDDSDDGLWDLRVVVNTEHLGVVGNLGK